MGSEKEDEIRQFKEFLSEFCVNHNGPVTNSDPLPFRLITFRLTKEEIEGECASWVIEYLQNQNNAPPLLVPMVVRETVKTVLSADLSAFVEENHHDDEEIEPCVEFNANGLARFVFSIVNEICAKWHENFPVFKLPKRIPQYSLQAIRNSRRKMEDRHVVISDMYTLIGDKLQSDKSLSFYAVYDGHGGVDASYYAAAHLHYIAIQDPQFEESPTRAMLSAFKRVDEAFISKAKREGLRSGTTGVTAVINTDCLHLAWLGDSQAVLMRNGKAVTIMEPHSPEREDEKQRIEEMGGCVVWFGAWRVNGSLSVSRSIGDPEYKPYVCSDADTAVIPLDGTEECVILACDGLWDGVTKEQACATVQENIDSGADLSQVSSILVNMAKENGSGDNITALIVYLNPYHRKNTELEPKESMENSVEQLEPSGSEMEPPEGNGTAVSNSETMENRPLEETDSGQTGGLNSNNNNCIVTKESGNSTQFVPVTEGKLLFTGPTVAPTQETAKLKRDISHSAYSGHTNTSSHVSRLQVPQQNGYLRDNTDSHKPRSIRRSCSEPPSLYSKSQNKKGVIKEKEADLEIVSRSKKTNHKVLPMKHNSMPTTLKPKSTNNASSWNRKKDPSGLLKTKDRKLRRTFPRGTRD